MPALGNTTKLSNMVNPQVMADMLDKKLVDNIRFAPLCRIDTTLVGRAGNAVTLPSFTFIGAAENVNEGDDIPIKTLTTATKSVTIQKAGIGVSITDEAILSGHGDPRGEAVSQIALSIASKLDNDVLAALTAITGAMEFTSAKNDAFTTDEISDALVKFGEDIEGPKVLLVSPIQYNVLRKSKDWLPASDIGANLILSGAVGMIYGCQVVISNKLTTPKLAFIVKPGALAIYLKRDTLVETDRDIVSKTTVVTADKHYAVYLYDESKAIKIKLP